MLGQRDAQRSYFPPHQYSLAMPNGVDMLVKVAMCHLHWKPRQCRFQGDASNAYGSMSRPKMALGLLDAEAECLVGYYAAGHTGEQPLYIDGEHLPVEWSKTGCRQGGAGEGAYFCYGLQPMLKNLAMQFPFGMCGRDC